MENEVNDFGSYLRTLRKEKKLTLVALAELTGLSHSYLSQLERGDRGVGGIPSPDILRKLAAHLGADYSDLMIKAGYITFDEWQKAFVDSDFHVDNDFVLRQVQENRGEKRELKILLDGIHSTYYNGHLLSSGDCQRILNILKEVFPEYQEKPEKDDA